MPNIETTRVEITRFAIEAWMRNIATGEFHYKNVLGLERVLTPKEDNKLRGIIFELCKAGVCESVGRRDGWYRTVQELEKPIQWQKVEAHKDSGLILPFNLRKYVFIYPDSVSIVAGSKSSGKTGFLYRTVALNMNRVNTILLSNLEGGVGMLRDRFSEMDIEIPDPAPFQLFYVTDNFQDYIKERDSLYVIDYIDAPEGIDFYLIGAAVAKVERKLQGLNSVAAIGLQKPAGRDTAFGGDQTLKVATLYIAMDNAKLKIVDAKVAADKKIHPRNMQWSFTYEDEGTRFSNIMPFFGE